MHPQPTPNQVSDKMTAIHFVPRTPARNGYCRTPGCLNGIGRRRAALGHTVCKECGEAFAAKERANWCVIQEYGKGAYQLVTPTAAQTTLRQTNQKAIRT